MTGRLCGRPTKKGRPCARPPFILPGVYYQADACHAHLSPQFRAVVDWQQRIAQAASDVRERVRLTAPPACWQWSVPENLATWTPPDPGSSVDRELWEANEGDYRAYELLTWWQAGRCAICGTTDASMVEDHDHATGLTRGHLCKGCNIREGRNPHCGGPIARYRERPPTAILGLTIRYLDPYSGEYAQPRPVSLRHPRRGSAMRNLTKGDQ